MRDTVRGIAGYMGYMGCGRRQGHLTRRRPGRPRTEPGEQDYVCVDRRLLRFATDEDRKFRDGPWAAPTNLMKERYHADSNFEGEEDEHNPA
jgi:hypothetical protein